MEAKATQALLNELIETLKEGQKGYAEAMTDVEDADLKETFKQLAVQRSGYINEIEDQMFKLDLHPDESTSVTSKVHRAFINLKGLVTGKDREAILNECERGEDYAVKVYQTALKGEGMTSALQGIIEKQHQGVQAAHDKIKALRNSAK